MNRMKKIPLSLLLRVSQRSALLALAPWSDPSSSFFILFLIYSVSPWPYFFFLLPRLLCVSVPLWLISPANPYPIQHIEEFRPALAHAFCAFNSHSASPGQAGHGGGHCYAVVAA